jgi:hypothetical protein
MSNRQILPGLFNRLCHAARKRRLHFLSPKAGKNRVVYARETPAKRVPKQGQIGLARSVESALNRPWRARCTLAGMR